MNTQTSLKEGIYIIQLEGELDASSSLDFDNLILDALNKGQNKILFDLTNLNYISSAGLGVFVSHLNTFEKSNIPIVLYGLQPPVQSVISVLGLDQLLIIVPTKSDALQKIHAQNI